ALAERRPDYLRNAVRCAQRNDLLLRVSPEEGILRLARHEFRDPAASRELDRCPDPLGRPFREADIAGLPAFDRASKRLHRLLERRVPVVAVALVEIDIIRLKPLQRRIELLFDLLTGQPAVALGHREEELGGEDVGIPAAPLQRLPE